MHLVIDYFAASFPFIRYDEESEDSIVKDIVSMICDFLNVPIDLAVQSEYAQNRFKIQYEIGENIILRLQGPELKSGHQSCSIELKGQGCREYESYNLNKTWFDFLEFFLIKLNANPTRIDIAIDDFKGKDIDINYIKDKLDRQCYTTTFKKKYYKIHGCDEEGYSLQFGSYTSTQMLVIYEKNKEQLAKDKICLQKYWLRFEMRFFHDKAYDVCMMFIKDENHNFNKIIYQLLYALLDIKEDNNYNDDSIYKVTTDKRYLSFLNNVEKGKIIREKFHSLEYRFYEQWIFAHTMFYTLYLLFQYDSIEEAIFILLVDVNNFANKIKKDKLKRLKMFIKEKLDVDIDYEGKKKEIQEFINKWLL